MKNFKKLFLVGLGVSLAVTLAACGGGEKASEKDKAYVPEKLTVQFVPSQAAETLEAKAKPLEKLLSNKLESANNEKR